MIRKMINSIVGDFGRASYFSALQWAQPGQEFNAGELSSDSSETSSSCLVDARTAELAEDQGCPVDYPMSVVLWAGYF